MNRRAWSSGLAVVAMLAGLTATRAADEGQRAALLHLAGLSSSDRPSLTAPADSLPRPATPDIMDPALVGTWEIMAPHRGGQSRWIWQILGDGTYRFHAEPYNSARPHEGVMTAVNGHWTLHALKGLRNWSDGGSYEIHDVVAVITGKLGTGAWKRSQQ
jgi:hypothetical protein